MPIFDYKCMKCKIQFEKRVNSASEEVKCDKCGSKCKKLLSAPPGPFKIKGVPHT